MTDNNGLYYMRARYYNPEIKSFINEDVVLGNVDDGLGLNRFAYVKGNPIRMIDPSGRWGENVHFNDTIAWAMDAGLTREDAELIAAGDLSVDNALSTNPLSGDQSWHFDRSRFDPDPRSTDTRQVHANEQLEYVQELIGRSADKSLWLWELGRGLHALQDIDAHLNAGYNAPNRIWWLHDDFNYGNYYDNTSMDYVNNQWVQRSSKYTNSRWLNTRNVSLDYLRKALK